MRYKVVYFLFSFVVSVYIIFRIVACYGPIMFCLFINLSPFLLIICGLEGYVQHLSQSGICNNAATFPGTTKKWNECLMPLLIMVTLHNPMYDMHEFFYTYSAIFCLWTCLAQLHLCAEKVFLHLDMHYIAITSCIYFLFICFCILLTFFFSFVIITDIMVWKWKILDLTMSNSGAAISVSLEYCPIL